VSVSWCALWLVLRSRWLLANMGGLKLLLLAGVQPMPHGDCDAGVHDCWRVAYDCRQQWKQVCVLLLACSLWLLAMLAGGVCCYLSVIPYSF
jgi:hypothetical protein